MLKVGVFGVGHLGKYHLNNWIEIPEVQVVGFFDPSNDNAKVVFEKEVVFVKGWWWCWAEVGKKSS